MSIVNWVKGKAPGKKLLIWQQGDALDSPWDKAKLDEINAALSAGSDVTSARALRVNAESGACYQGQTHGHKGFLLAPDEAREMLRQSKRNAGVIFPFLIADDLLGRPDGTPSRYVVDFQTLDAHTIREYEEPYSRVKALVMPDIVKNAREEREKTGSESGPRQAHAQQWWRHGRGRGELVAKLPTLSRYIACSRVTKRPIFEFISCAVHPNDALQVFTLADDYSFGILHSSMHWAWFTARCSTFKGDPRYTSDSVFDSFAWPQEPTLAQARKVARAAVELRSLRRAVMEKHGLSRRDLYRQVDEPGKSPIKDAHAALDAAARDAYGMKAKADVLAFLLALNLDLADREAKGQTVVGPGLPGCVIDRRPFVTADCVEAPKL